MTAAILGASGRAAADAAGADAAGSPARPVDLARWFTFATRSRSGRWRLVGNLPTSCRALSDPDGIWTLALSLARADGAPSFLRKDQP